jgi:hypothetical protein
MIASADRDKEPAGRHHPPAKDSRYPQNPDLQIKWVVRFYATLDGRSASLPLSQILQQTGVTSRYCPSVTEPNAKFWKCCMDKVSNYPSVKFNLV